MGKGDRIMPGLWQRLGGFGTKVIRTAQQLGRSLGETLRIIKPIAPFVEPMAAARDWGRVTTADALEPQIIALRPDEQVPHDLFVVSDIPWKDKFAYQVSIFGRDRRTGRFKRQVYDMSVSREMTIQEVVETAKLTFGRCQTAHFAEFWDVKVTGAWKSAEVEW